MTNPVQHVVADYLSLQESGEAGDGVRDEFPDAELFRITTEPTTDSTVSEEEKWLTDMHQFLSSRLPPDKMDWDERKRLAVRNRHFYLIQAVDRIWWRAV